LKKSRVDPILPPPIIGPIIVNKSNGTNYITMVKGQTTFCGMKYTLSPLTILSKNKLIKWSVINGKALPVRFAHINSNVEATI
jgi:hypothetical protein